MAHLQGSARAAYVRRMFERIAPHYDFVNTFMAAGRERAWRRAAIRAAAVPEGGRVLDVATGTGDLALQVVRQNHAQVVGIDFTLAMMQVGQAKPGGLGVRWACADALQLPFADDTFDAVVSGFMMRNVIDVPAAFAEQRRVVNPGGRVVCLEISHTPWPVFRQLFRLYFYHLVPLIGGLISGQPEAYVYLPNSLTNFFTAEELAEVMRSVGLGRVRFRRLMLGTVALHVGIKV